MKKTPYLYLIAVLIAVLAAMYQHNIDTTPIPLAVEDAIFVNDIAIKRVDYLTALTMISDEKKEPMKTIDHQLIVNRLIEEELLFQYGLAQQYIYHPEISRLIVTNLLDTISAQHDSKQYSEKELYEIYLTKIIKSPSYELLDSDLKFEDLKEQLSGALREIDRNKVINEYIKWLRNRADISSVSDLTKNIAIKNGDKHE